MSQAPSAIEGWETEACEGMLGGTDRQWRGVMRSHLLGGVPGVIEGTLTVGYH